MGWLFILCIVALNVYWFSSLRANWKKRNGRDAFFSHKDLKGGSLISNNAPAAIALFILGDLWGILAVVLTTEIPWQLRLGTVILTVVSLLHLFPSLYFLNRRLVCRTDGFTYQSMFRRRSEYTYADIRTFRPHDGDLLLRFPGHIIHLEASSNWKQLQYPYDAFRRAQGLESILRAEQEKEAARQLKRLDIIKQYLSRNPHSFWGNLHRIDHYAPQFRLHIIVISLLFILASVLFVIHITYRYNVSEDYVTEAAVVDSVSWHSSRHGWQMWFNTNDGRTFKLDYGISAFNSDAFQRDFSPGKTVEFGREKDRDVPWVYTVRMDGQDYLSFDGLHTYQTREKKLLLIVSCGLFLLALLYSSVAAYSVKFLDEKRKLFAVMWGKQKVLDRPHL